MLFVDKETKKRINPKALSPIILKSERKSFEECVDKYGNMIWALAKSQTFSSEEAELLTQKIFKDIRECVNLHNPEKCSEKAFIAFIAYRRLTVH